MLNKRILVLMFLLLFLPLVGCLTPSNQAPILTSSPVTTATVGVLYTYDVNAKDPDGDTLIYSLAVKPSGMTIKSATGVISWRPTSTQIGDNPVTVKVSDGTLSITQSFKIKVGTLPTVNQAPVIISTPVTTAIVGLTYFYDVNATDPNGDILIYSLTACPGGMVISSSNGLIMWTPISEGSYAVVVNVSDGALSDTQGFTVVVSKPTVPVETYTITSSAGPGGTISPLGDVTLIKGSDKLFTIIPDTGYSIEKVLVDGSSVGVVNTYTFNDVTKDHAIHATFSAVEPEPEPVVNHKPSITSTPIITAILGVPYVYDVGATDPDGDVLTYSLTTKPVGMTINPVTGVISWIPNATGQYAIVVKASDGELSDIQGFGITVSTVEIIGIEVEPDEMTLVVGESKAITSVTATYEIKTGLEADIPLEACTYASDPSGVVTIDAGIVTAIHEGGTTITVTYAGKEDEIVVTVFQPLDKPVRNIDTNEYFYTIQKAIIDDDTKDGHTIEVAPGMYAEDEIHINKSLTVQGAGRSSTTIDATGIDKGFYIEADYVTIKDLTVKNATYRNIVLGMTVSNITIDNVASLDSGYAGLAVQAGNVTNLVIDNSLFSGNAIHGMRIDTAGVVNGMTITNSHFDGNLEAGANFYGSVTNVSIENSTFNDNLTNGIYVESLSNATFTNVTANNNSEAGCNINLKGGAVYENLGFNDCTFMGNGTTDEAGLIIQGKSLSLDNVDINGGTFSGNKIGISIGNNVTDIEIHDANIYGNYHTFLWGENVGVLNYTVSGTINATYNWWGDASGPLHTTNPFGKGDAVYGDVNYEHWLPGPH